MKIGKENESKNGVLWGMIWYLLREKRRRRWWSIEVNFNLSFSYPFQLNIRYT